jgi:hypothetical protein
MSANVGEAPIIAAVSAPCSMKVEKDMGLVRLRARPLAEYAAAQSGTLTVTLQNRRSNAINSRVRSRDQVHIKTTPRYR